MISLTKDDFPEPDTPVTQVKTPRGKATSIFFKLFARAPLTVNQRSGMGRRSTGKGIILR